MRAATSVSLWPWQIPVMDVVLDQRRDCIYNAFCTAVCLCVHSTERQHNLNCHSWASSCMMGYDHIRGIVTPATCSRANNRVVTCGHPRPPLSLGRQWWTGWLRDIREVTSCLLLSYMCLHFAVLYAFVLLQQRQTYLWLQGIVAHVLHVH